MKRSREAQQNPAVKLVKGVGIGVLSALLSMLLLLTLVSLVLKVAGSVSQSAAGIVTVVIAAGGGFIGGNVTARILKSRGLMAGLLTALIVAFVVFIIGFFLSGNDIQGTNLIKHGILIIGGCAGGVMGANHRSRRK